jgi:ribosomal protein L12E/L44/L45/RPP1/RPP2
MGKIPSVVPADGVSADSLVRGVPEGEDDEDDEEQKEDEEDEEDQGEGYSE